MSLFSVDSTGVITVDSSGIKDAFVSAYKNALGSTINTEAGTFQGQMILNDTAMLTYAQNQCVLVANSYSALTATGSALDVVANFWGYYRKSGVATVVNCTLGGTAGTVISAGSLVSDGTYDYALLDETTIGENGRATAQFQCTTTGAISVVSGGITEIITEINGWDTVYNNNAGVTGYDVESDNSFRARITQNWFNVRARGALGAIWDNMSALDNVVSVLVRENPYNTDIVIDDFVLPEHSVFVCVAGGSSEDIAECMYNQKTIGANTSGNTMVTYYDSTTGLTNRYYIERAEEKNLIIQVQYSSSYYTTADVEEQIKTAIMGWYAKNPFVIGQTISGGMIAQAFNGFVFADILSIKVGIAGDSSESSEVDYQDFVKTTIGQIAVLEEDFIECLGEDDES